jgi:hypothetical protein
MIKTYATKYTKGSDTDQYVEFCSVQNVMENAKTVEM